ncbi:sigma factor-like helix-turn-helix DNA-binding protein [Streptomyces longwoodensis]|uniref:sigma factor-like helix-turn-helix DNA-binding protein n=1 Tax=Streptomyces longwoodensis TaxID=68231 RepID=UPI0036F4C7A7
MARKFGELGETVVFAIRRKRQAAIRRMRTDEGMVYRQIADRLSISFGRVRQILAVLGDPPADRKS